MIKIDIEGFEYFAFMGGKQLLQGPNAPDILFEFVYWAEEKANLQKGSAQQVLLNWGYTLYNLVPGKQPMRLNNILTSGGAQILATRNPRW